LIDNIDVLYFAYYSIGGCGGIYTDKQGNFTSPGFPKMYPSDMECVHIIQVPKDNVIKLNFEK